ncbi:hypothetical protein FORC47_p362 (plasmid) [Bacillus cereus]|nr:hypothetical protein FORC47_p362 [Bacillus cereus]
MSRRGYEFIRVLYNEKSEPGLIVLIVKLLFEKLWMYVTPKVFE